MKIFFELDSLRKDGEMTKRNVAYNCWMIWKTRCEMVIGGQMINVKQIVKRIRIAELEYNGAVEDMITERRNGTMQADEVEVKWKKSDDDWLKIN